jgi:glucuronoarabinoxylan endo-1,4-beta-xylanase
MKILTPCRIALLCLALPIVASAQTDAINFTTTYQTIRGFGTSTAWQPVLDSNQAHNLFGTGAGQVGLTILRQRIDPSSTTGGSNWQTELNNAQQVQSINSQVIVFATPWTPPAVWKSNGSVDDGTLNTADYDNFANYLNAYIAYQKAGGVNLYAISVQNEPDFLPDYESCGYSGAQMDAWIAQEGGKINTKLMMPESDSYNLDESDPTLNDSNAVGHVSIVAGHTYGVNPFYYTNAKNKGKDVWMTETTYNNANGAAQPSISDAIAAAVLYHQSMAVAQYNAYVYWWTPLLLNGDSPNLDAYALGQYSKFVRPGYVMNGANNNPTSGVYVTAYSGSGNYVIVAVNSNGGSSNMTFDISGATLTSVTPYQTSASNQLAQLGAVSVSNNAFTYSLPGQSITTFVGGGSTTCTPSPIVPYISVAGVWSAAGVSSATVTSTSTAVDLGPWPETGGSWAWTGPNGFTSTSREIDNIALSAGANVYTATYTDSCGNKSTQAFTITVTSSTGSFTLKPSASTLSIAQSSSGTDTITVTDVSPFSGSVAFTASGMPSGVTAAFSPTSSTTSSVLTLTASSTATTGASTVTVTGTSGSLSATTTITLAVTAASCTPTAIVPYISVAGVWSAAGVSSATVASTSTAVDLGPQPSSGGSWAWTGPNGFTSTSREIDNIALSAGANVYTATYTNSCGAKSTQAFTITVTSSTGSFSLKPSSSSLSVTQGASGTDTITVTDVSPFSGSVTLAASGLPSGVTAAFATNPATSTSVLTLTASSSAATGSSTVTITGTSGSLSATTTIALTVSAASAGSFSLKPSASTLTVKQGASGTDTITVTDVSPFSGSVTLAASGLPSGVTAAFATNPATSTSVLTLTASSSAATGSSTVTITGTSGSLSATTTIALTVSTSGGGSACTVDYTISPQTSSAFGAAVTIVNNGTTALSNWTLTWSFANGQTIASSWNGTASQSGANVTVSEQSGQTWENIPAGGSYSGFGFNGTWNGTTNAIPTAFSLNGTACTVN